MQIQIELPEPEPTTLQPMDAPLDLLFEDQDLLVVNKPAGLVVHPAAGHAQDTLVNILLHHVKTLAMGFSENRPGIVHRLDRDTSGILVVAKNDLAHHHLARQFRLKTAHRIYWALVFGTPAKKEGTIKSHLARHPQDRKRFASHKGGAGKLAITHYKLLKTFPGNVSWIQCKLETGRTHQIRVHLSEAGHPILGDTLYGGKTRLKSISNRVASLITGAKRIALHATELGFEHPRNHENMLFRLGWPEDLKTLIEALGDHDV
jgi:23S rRNA pseudouridine1911/1915/1917 synthase